MDQEDWWGKGQFCPADQHATPRNMDQHARVLKFRFDQPFERFHADDRLMLWFDFFNHDNARVISNMEAFMSEVAPRVAEAMNR